MNRLAVLLLFLMVAAIVRAEPPPETSTDQDAPSVSAFDAERFVGRVVTVTGHPPCVDCLEHSLKYGLLDRRKKTVFRVLVRIPGIDTNAYLIKLFNSKSFTVRGRIDWDTPLQKAPMIGWDWTGGPQMVVTTLDQIRFVLRSQPKGSAENGHKEAQEAQRKDIP